MPKKPVNYQNSFVYKIVCQDVSVKDVYVGSTTDFKSRKNNHHQKSKTEDTKLYNFIRNHGGWYNFDMVLIEQVSCESSLELKKLERHYVETLHATLNTKLPSRSLSEFRDVHHEELKEYERQLYQRHTKHVKLKNIQCECG